MLDCPFFVLKFLSSSSSSFEIIKTMTKTPNYRNKVQAKTAKKKLSKKHRCNHTHKFWRNKALRSQGIFDQIRNLNKEVEEIKEEKEKEEKEEIAVQLEVARREISQGEARCQVSIRRAKRDRNNAMRRNSERWQQRERELKEKHEQERSEWMEEVEHHETGYREAM